MVHFSTTEVQRREAFVSQRLREKFLTTAGKINGHVPPEEWSIESWLNSQRRARRPEQGPWGWEGYAELTTCVSDSISERVDKGNFDITLLADPSPRSQYPKDVRGGKGAGLRTLLIHLADTGAKVYMKSEWGPDCIVLHFSERDVAIDFDDTPEATFFDASGTHYLSVLIDSWRRGGPQYRQARAFLCDILAAEVYWAKAAAELDFAMAVAVSEDGKRILAADCVFVFDAGKWLRYSPSVFSSDKIAISEQYCRVGLPFSLEGSNERVLSDLIGHMKTEPKQGAVPFLVRNFTEGKPSNQILFVHNNKAGLKQRFLVTTSDLLTGSMPEGERIFIK